jgi:membrane protein implicated in regulation of membrane protease activity
MITVKKIFKLILLSVLPLIIYEVGAVGFYIFMLGSASLRQVHKIAWSQDLVILLPVLCCAIFFYYMWVYFMREEQSVINVPRYERPKHERYMESKYDSMS